MRAIRLHTHNPAEVEARKYPPTGGRSDSRNNSKKTLLFSNPNPDQENDGNRTSNQVGTLKDTAVEAKNPARAQVPYTLGTTILYWAI